MNMSYKIFKSNYIITALVVIIANQFSKVEAGTSSNCFYNDQLVFIYDLYDYSGEFSNVREYDLKPGVSCDFIVDVNSKITWWSEDQISITAQEYHDRPSNQYGCQSTHNDKRTYVSDTNIEISKEKSDDKVCMVKYYLTNNNLAETMRI